MAMPILIPLPNIFFFVLLLLPPKFHNANVTLNRPLSTDDQNFSWVSSSKDFAFGFRPINNTNLFLLAIWFDNIPGKTIVWSANTSSPIPRGSQVQLTAKGITLTNPQGEALWTIEPLGNVSHGAMLDTGNFVLATSDSSYLWESFKNPTDTLLPTQTLDVNSNLSSRLTSTNYTKGRFELYFENGNLLMSQIGWPTESRYDYYYNINATNANDTVLQLVFDKTEGIYVKTEAGDKKGFDWGNPEFDFSKNYYRATLEYNGVFNLYSHPKGSNGNQVWLMTNYVPDNICTKILSEYGSGSCGYNSYCSMENGMPTCGCPPGYSKVDPNNEFGGCQPDISLGCGVDDEAPHENPKEVYEFQFQQYVNWPLGDYERLYNFSQDECQNSCLYDCNCAAVIYNDFQECWKKRLPLSNGRQEVINFGQMAIFKTRIRSLSNLGPIVKNIEDRDRVNPALLGSLIGSIIVNTLLVATVILILLLKHRKIIQSSSLLETNLHSFSYEALEEATHGFNEEVGRGSFGIVYKGSLISGSDNVVAVKRLDRLAQEREKEFRTELSTIGRTCHKNLVRLIGFCDEGVHRLLVYEFMSNGTLADILFGRHKPIWNLRVSFALGIARGLLYLHEECDTPVIHCDIKPQNILLDEHFMVKISDFGLAKLLYSNQSRTHTMIRGTKGYVAPEWFKNVPVTPKVDVYSFGVMLLEIICCRRSVMIDVDGGEEEKAVLTDWTYDCYMAKRIELLVENDRDALEDKGRLVKWVMTAMWCIQENHKKRPNMKTVMQMLEGLVDVPSPPAPSSFNLLA